MTDLWWFDSWAWRAYLAANNESWHTNFGPTGNLVVALDDRCWSRIRKGHQAAIRAAERDGVTVTESFDDYREVHRLANGIVRPEATFAVMRGWVSRCGFALVAWFCGVPAAAVYFVHDGAGSYYFSGPRNPNVDVPGATHLLIWKAMERLRGLGVRWVDCGPLPDDDPKHISIAHFKRGFGATARMWPDYV